MNSGSWKRLGRTLPVFLCGIGTLLVAGCLLFSAVEHLGQPYSFLLAVLRYDLVAGTMAQWVAIAVPAFQFALAVLMVSFQAPRCSSLAAALLIAFFTLVQVSALVRGLDISCGCFGSFSESISWWTIGRNLVLIAVSAWLFFASRKLPVYQRTMTTTVSEPQAPVPAI